MVGNPEVICPGSGLVLGRRLLASMQRPLLGRFTGHYDQFTFLSKQDICSLFGLFLPARVFGMAQVRTLLLLLRRDRSGRFTSRHGIAPHCLLESGR